MSRMNTVVVLTALNVEYNAVRKHLADLQLHRHEAGTRFEVGSIPDTDCRIALGLTGAGNAPAAVLAERAIHEFRPVAILFVGIAGALWDSTALGDVVIASRVYAYHGGTSEDDGFFARPRTWEAPHHLAQLVNHVARSQSWMDRLSSHANPPKVHFSPIAAGEIVQNSRVSREADWVRTRYNDAAAIEMEAAGVAQAAHFNGAPVGIVRGISDRADGTKTSHGDVMWQPQAAINAAAFAVHLAAELIAEETIVPSRRTETALSPASVFNVASGTVGIQAGNVSGSTVWMNVSPVGPRLDDMAAAVSALRVHLDRDYANREVDEDTYEAACAELKTAENALGESSGAGRKTSLLALKRLSGLVTGTTNIAANIAAVITAVNALS
ncbi:MAG TPA: 5'-methylthioadenosine/S-adenosylhomocysteine nucleosidase [Candidatus Stackebrandtia excrementipullorum]|nr:5'-methylthioadenosine/S-adenosylhomocysteine nucleosidase [Candidatus Stackebrandtia excrementipullorum]